jgi:hypothetical protein
MPAATLHLQQVGNHHLQKEISFITPVQHQLVHDWHQSNQPSYLVPVANTAPHPQSPRHHHNRERKQRNMTKLPKQEVANKHNVKSENKTL